MEMNKHEEYLAPALELIQVNVEKGFAQTGGPGEAGPEFGNGGSWDF